MDTCACVNTRTSTAQRCSSYRHRHQQQPCGFNNSTDIVYWMISNQQLIWTQTKFQLQHIRP